MISILVCSRVAGNVNFRLFNLLDSLKRMSSNYENFEVLVKFDSDDKKVRGVVPELGTYPFKAKYLIEPRGRGYLDLHIFYNRLFSQVDERSQVIVAMGDDFEIIQEGWDDVVLSKVNVYHDQVFIIHGRPHPPISRRNYQEQKFYLDFDISSIEDIDIIDEAPLWSRKLLNICGGFGNASSTDCWTLNLEHFLFHRCGINRTIFLEQPIIKRMEHMGIDKEFNLRWWTDRAKIFTFIRSDFYKTLVEHQAVNIYCYLKALELSALPPPLVQKESDFKPTVLTPDSLRRLKREETIRNLIPPFLRPAVIRVYRKLYYRFSRRPFELKRMNQGE